MAAEACLLIPCVNTDDRWVSAVADLERNT
jgi:hypothetical protein